MINMIWLHQLQHLLIIFCKERPCSIQHIKNIVIYCQYWNYWYCIASVLLISAFRHIDIVSVTSKIWVISGYFTILFPTFNVNSVKLGILYGNAITRYSSTGPKRKLSNNIDITDYVHVHSCSNRCDVDKSHVISAICHNIGRKMLWQFNFWIEILGLSKFRHQLF